MLNGSLAIEVDNDRVTLNFDKAEDQTDKAFMGFSTAERIRIDAVSRQAFYTAAGDDALLDQDEFKQLALRRFSAADFNSNQTLIGGELKAFADLLLLRETNVNLA